MFQLLQNKLSQCTFWCSVLSDPRRTCRRGRRRRGLNAPFGAQCFPTGNNILGFLLRLHVSMHLLVLSAFRPNKGPKPVNLRRVSMHLLVLSAFRLLESFLFFSGFFCLNAPFGAQCFPTPKQKPWFKIGRVSMHLLVLSAFRLHHVEGKALLSINVSMHLLVLSAFRQELYDRFGGSLSRSQCTFWCSVLSDSMAQSCGSKPTNIKVSMHLLVLSAFRLDGAKSSWPPHTI